jgi:hypothetical protein
MLTTTYKLGPYIVFLWFIIHLPLRRTLVRSFLRDAER